ncbi:MAG: class I SAM-dependent methyltransferase [Candidatus Sulfotelmatobacter sp.]
MRLTTKSIPKPVLRFLRTGFSQLSAPVMSARGYLGARNLRSEAPVGEHREVSNPIRDYFDSHTHGQGIWKWRHYFEIYHRHFQKFIGRPVNVLEVGIFSGGSLAMWHSYFGRQCHIYGVDIEPACLAYQTDSVTIVIGDQGDRTFWRTFKQKIPRLDLIIDDGSHRAADQIVTLEELLPHLNPGGVYVCEDVHNSANRFAQYLNGFAANLNASDLDWQDHEISSPVTPFQAAIHSVHLYPYVIVIEKTESRLQRFVGPRHGTEWQPFISANGTTAKSDGG